MIHLTHLAILLAGPMLQDPGIAARTELDRVLKAARIELHRSLKAAGWEVPEPAPYSLRADIQRVADEQDGADLLVASRLLLEWNRVRLQPRQLLNLTRATLQRYEANRRQQRSIKAVVAEEARRGKLTRSQATKLQAQAATIRYVWGDTQNNRGPFLYAILVGEASLEQAGKRSYSDWCAVVNEYDRLNSSDLQQLLYRQHKYLIEVKHRPTLDRLTHPFWR